MGGTLNGKMILVVSLLSSCGIRESEFDALEEEHRQLKKMRLFRPEKLKTLQIKS